MKERVRPLYTDAEDEFLIANVGRLSHKQMAEQLGRSWNSVRDRLKKLRAQGRVDDGAVGWLTYEDIEQAFGWNFQRVKRRAHAGRIERRYVTRGGKRIVVFRAEDVQREYDAASKPKRESAKRPTKMQQREAPAHVRVELGVDRWWAEEGRLSVDRRKPVAVRVGDPVWVRKLVPSAAGGERWGSVRGKVYAVTDKLVVVEFPSGYRESFSRYDVRPVEVLRRAG